MKSYVLYNNDVEAATFAVEQGMVQRFTPLRPELLPKQLCKATPDGFTLWVRERAIDLNVLMHRQLVKGLMGTWDKLTLALMTHMFSVTDTFTCFEKGLFVQRCALCVPEEQQMVSSFILLSGDTSLRRAHIVTPNVSTDGSFTKTWAYENGEWWLYKLQPSDATKGEVNISRVLRALQWAAAEYRYIGNYRKRVKSRNFVGPDEFFEPYDSLRYMFDDPSDDEDVVCRNMASLGVPILSAWKKLMAADALFANTDRHMRNFGVIRSAVTGDILRLAPNFDNNQAYRANPGGRYSDGILKAFLRHADREDRDNLRALTAACENNPYLKDAFDAGRRIFS